MSDTSIWMGPSPTVPSGEWNDPTNWVDDNLPAVTSQFDYNSDTVVLPLVTQGPNDIPVPYKVLLNNVGLPIYSYYNLASLTLGSDTFGAAPGSFNVELDIDGGDPTGGSGLSVFAHTTSVSTDGGVVLSDGAYFSVGAPSYDNAEGPAFDPSPVMLDAVVFADGTGSVLSLGGTGPLEDIGGPRSTIFTHPDDFQTPVIGFGGNNLISISADSGYFQATTGGTVTLSYVPGYQGGVLSVIGEPPPGAAAGTPDTPFADIDLVGDYETSNFSITSLNSQLAIAFSLNQISSTGDRQVIQGTVASDLITAAGSLDTIYGNGGNDTIRTAGSYEKIVIGFTGDQLTFPEFLPSTLTDTITLNGRANTVDVGDENAVITGSVGYDLISLGYGTDHVSVGAYSTVRGIGGTYDVTALGGNTAITLNGNSLLGDTPYPTPGTSDVTLGGTSNVVNVDGDFHFFTQLVLTGGTGSSDFTIGNANATLVTGGLNNHFSLGGGVYDVTTGSGYATVDLTNGDSGTQATIRLAGTHNVVSGQAGTIDVSGGAGSNSVLLGDNASQQVTIDIGGLYNTIVVSNTAQGSVTAGSGYDRVSIAAPADPGDASPGTIQVNLAGVGNIVSATGASVNVQGGTGLGTFTLSDGDDTLTTGGSHNMVTLGSGTSTVDPGSDRAIVVLNGSNAHLMLQGENNAVFLNAGASGTIGGGVSPDLHITIAPGIGAEVLQGALADPRTVITLTGGAGGYATPQAVVAALHSDGAGGTLLQIGSGSLDFAGVGASAIHAGSFVIRA